MINADEAAAEWVHPKTLTPWAENPRKNDGDPVKRVIESIKRFGFGAPIVARKENREIIAGHTRVKAAIELKLERVPVRFLDIPEREARLLALADNRLPEMTEWSETLGAVLSGYDLAEVEMAGWSQDDLDKMAAELAASDPDLEEDEVPGEPLSPIAKLGDIWGLGRHRLFCGDGREAYGGTRFGSVVTDPPYGISVVKRGMVGSADFGVVEKGRYEPIAGDDEVPDVGWLLERGETAIIWGGNYFADQLPPTGSWLIWDKRGDSGIENTFADCELAWSNRSGPARIHRQLWVGMIREGEHDKRQHPTQKPVKLMGFCLGFCQGDVFEPYCGSGSTLIASEQMNRTCYASELAPAYCDVIIERWQNLTGQSAQRIESGQG